MRLRLFLPVAILAVTVSAAQAQTDTTPPKPDSAAKTDSTSREKSVLAGVFTEEQASKGDSEHQANCSACHGTENYVGEAFTRNWVGRTAFDLFDQLKTTMPEDNPGGLSAQQYTDIIAYIFKINGLPAGAAALPADPEALRLIKIESKPAGNPAQLGSRPAVPRRTSVAGSTRVARTYRPHSPVVLTARR
ncbi:MAG TPA: cytochrome c [Gemmatimonadaceae bacterium]|jgi:hypothetical protein|nr:cytochrome c [Gemmatimonadaceae bacterium]